MLIDTHAHVYHKRFHSDMDDVIRRAFDNGIEAIIMPAIDVQSIEDAIELAQKHKGLYVMSALHPSDVKDASEADFQRVIDLCDDPSVVAVGESGLDYYWDRSFDEKQHNYFRRHIQLAIEKDLPLILHNRESDDDLVSILTEEKASSEDGDRLRGIFHCFGGSVEFANSAISLGFLLGIGGTLTFKNSGVAATLEHVDLANIVIETDAPFLAPEPFRGKRNEPAYVRYVAERLAVVYDTSFETIAKTTTATAKQLFDID